jgi:hypothetical protein
MDDILSSSPISQDDSRSSVYSRSDDLFDSSSISQAESRFSVYSRFGNPFVSDQTQPSPCKPYSINKRSSFLPRRPEVNQLDHLIRTFHGSTIALDTMRSPLREAKSREAGSLHGRHKDRETELESHVRENQFYGTCYDLYRDLYRKVDHARKQLMCDFDQDRLLFELESLLVGPGSVLFKPSLVPVEQETSPQGNQHLYDTVQELDKAVRMSRVLEAKAQRDFTRYWKIPQDIEQCERWI